jgi:hypothetical protein
LFDVSHHHLCVAVCGVEKAVDVTINEHRVAILNARGCCQDVGDPVELNPEPLGLLALVVLGKQ